MSMISSVTSAAANLATGFEAITTPPPRAAPRSAEASTLAKGGGLDLLSAKGAGGAKPAPTKTPAKKPAAGTGYASAGTDFAFLKDPTLSVEEKLFRFMCAIAKRNDDAVVKKMEEMKGEAARAAAKSSGSTAPKKSGGFTVWSALKTIFPVLGFTAKALGDAKVKAMVSQLSGPVLAAGASALGLPMLAPLALSAAPDLTGAILDMKLGDEASEVGRTGSGSRAGSSGSSSSSGSNSSSGSATSSGAASGQNEQVQLMELQRLIDKQKEMFAMVSNILRAQHDTRMSIIGNVR